MCYNLTISKATAILLRIFLIITTVILPLPAHAHSVHNLKADHLLHADLRVMNGYPVAGDTAAHTDQALIANARPAFGWEILSDAPGTVQSAYRVIVSADRDTITSGTGDAWDSGKVASGESGNVLYDGAPLRPATTYYWRVMTWDASDNSSDWSDIARFTTADTLAEYQTSIYPLQKTDETATTITTTGNITRLDFGKASFGQLKMTLSSRDGGDTITVRLGEAINPDGSINRKPGGTIRYAEYQVHLRPGRHTYQLQFTPDKRNTGPPAVLMPESIGEVLPFRYCEIEGTSQKPAPGDIVRASVHYPFNDHAAHFESSDEILNAVWEMCKYSIKATSFAGIYVDGDRERIPYEADAYINQLCHYAVDQEYTMARRSHEYLLHHATWPTEWILQSVLMAYNDYLYTGDARSAAHHYDDLKAKLLLPLREDNGLISTTRGKQTPDLMKAIHFNGKALRDIVDWPHTGGFGMEGNGETDGFVFTDFNAVVNAFHYKALRDMQSLATVLGHTDDAARFADLAGETHAAFQSLLWDDQNKVYRDGIDTDHAALHTNMLALTFGLVPPDRQTAVLDFIRSRGMACSVYGSQFLMDAIYDAGDAHYGLSLLTSQSDRSWYNMIRAGSTISMEAWDNKYKPNQDWNHAWGAVPANIIPRKLMGIEPVTPGWKEFRVRPQTASIQWAKIKVPTPHGSIHLETRQTTASQNASGPNTADQKVRDQKAKVQKAKDHTTSQTTSQTTPSQTYTLTVPANTTAHFSLPGTTAPRQITLNEKPIHPKTEQSWINLPPLPSGKHTINITD